MVRDMTQDNLRSAFGGESQAHMRYRIWAVTAEKKDSQMLLDYSMQLLMLNKYMQHYFKALRDCPGDFAVTSMAGFGYQKLLQIYKGAINMKYLNILKCILHT